MLETWSVSKKQSDVVQSKQELGETGPETSGERRRPPRHHGDRRGGV